MPAATSRTRRRMCAATIRNGSIRISHACSATSARRRARRSPRRAPLDLRVNTLKGDRDEAAAALADLAPEPTRWSPYGLRIKLTRRRQEPGDPRRAGLSEGPGRDPGRGLAACGAAGRRQARRAGARSLRRRRRQDAGARGRDGEQGPALRHRQRQAPARADPRPAGALRRAQCPGPHAEIRRQRTRRSRRPDRPRADRRALHRHRRLAAQSGRQMAGPARRAGAAASRSRPRRSSVPSPLVKPGGRIAYVTCSVLEEENGAQVRGFVARAPGVRRGTARRGGERCWASAPSCFTRAALMSDEGLLMTPRRTDTDGFFVSVLKRG